MPITRIEIRNVKGIQNKVIDQEIIPNKPSILVAPNGFGKSSIAVAFKSLNANRIRLNDDNLYENDEVNRPFVELRFKRPDNTILTLQADDNANTIAGEFDYFVINNQVRAKAVRVPGHGGATNVSASLHIDEMVLVNTIPENIAFNYTITEEREHFGQNGKVLDNIISLFGIKAALEVIDDNLSVLERFRQVRLGNRLQQQVDAINIQPGTTAQIKAWAEVNVLPQLEAENEFHTLADLLAPFLAELSRLEIILAVFQISQLYLRDRNNFKAALARKRYECERDEYVEAFTAFNSTWKDIRPRQRDEKLVVQFPKAHTISNGQRDVLCFVTLLEQARKKLRRQKSILVIDEVFDYLDDANLIVAQYYISNFIAKFKGEGREIYPLILCHLDPNYFKSFLFSNLKIYYLDKRPSAINVNMRRLITLREDPLIKDDVSKYLLHFDPGQINRVAAFAALNLHVPWATGNAFRTFVQGQITNYLNNQPCDPFAICCGVRRKVEENIYNLIPGAADKTNFLNTHMTREKLDFAEAIGVSVPEYYYLLGIIYNGGMHWKNNFDNESPLITKLENTTIRRLISEVFS